MKTQQNITLIITGILILVFTYTALSKLLAFDAFRSQMLSQPLPSFLTENLIWALPAVELLVAGFLVFSKTRIIGYYFSIALMILFTGYTALMTLDVFAHVPCSCGGIIESLSWEQHLFLNVVLLFLALAGLYLKLNSEYPFPNDYGKENSPLDKRGLAKN